ncbi:uncharacterized protein PG986_006424 [Apiospora aurea]|uniref:Uncharacterized protein n=1 Tax=Apiospora aurea TaxID=335848 RepID=A0ABR1QKD1_9PEZI
MGDSLDHLDLHGERLALLQGPAGQDLHPPSQPSCAHLLPLASTNETKTEGGQAYHRPLPNLEGFLAAYGSDASTPIHLAGHEHHQPYIPKIYASYDVPADVEQHLEDVRRVYPGDRLPLRMLKWAFLNWCSEMHEEDSVYRGQGILEYLVYFVVNVCRALRMGSDLASMLSTSLFASGCDRYHYDVGVGVEKLDDPLAPNPLLPLVYSRNRRPPCTANQAPL